jgi:succinate-semialdehyde dehydrogenase/glutarate-semialdehyde dehydrogenase
MAAAIDDIRVRLADRNLLRDRCYVAGKGLAAADGRTVPVTDLSTGKGMATVASLRLEEARRATAAAKRALPVWRAKTASERAAISRPLVRARYGPRRRSRLQRDARAGEAARGGQRRDCVRHLVRRMVRQEGQACLRRRDPAKGCLAADPRLDTTVMSWNFPNAMLTRNCSPRLAAGCTIVVGPASATPFSWTRVGELAERTGVPPDVFNVVTGASNVVGTELATKTTIRNIPSPGRSG